MTSDIVVQMVSSGDSLTKDIRFRLNLNLYSPSSRMATFQKTKKPTLCLF